MSEDGRVYVSVAKEDHERLLAERDRLKAALEKVTRLPNAFRNTELMGAVMIARAALEPVN